MVNRKLACAFRYFQKLEFHDLGLESLHDPSYRFQLHVEKF